MDIASEHSTSPGSFFLIRLFHLHSRVCASLDPREQAHLFCITVAEPYSFLLQVKMAPSDVLSNAVCLSVRKQEASGVQRRFPIQPRFLFCRSAAPTRGSLGMFKTFSPGRPLAAAVANNRNIS